MMAATLMENELKAEKSPSVEWLIKCMLNEAPVFFCSSTRKRPHRVAFQDTKSHSLLMHPLRAERKGAELIG